MPGRAENATTGPVTRWLFKHEATEMPVCRGTILRPVRVTESSVEAAAVSYLSFCFIPKFKNSFSDERGEFGEAKAGMHWVVCLSFNLPASICICRVIHMEELLAKKETSHLLNVLLL